MLGCDCLGVIHYFDANLVDDSGEPFLIKNAICMHEEDAGMGWKHTGTSYFIFSFPSMPFNFLSCPFRCDFQSVQFEVD